LLAQVDALRSLFNPAVLKFGITHCPVFRFFNHVYGYWIDNWEHLYALHVGSPQQAQYLEKLLIKHYDGLHTNDRKGGESPPLSVGWTYVAISNGAFAGPVYSNLTIRRKRLEDPRIVWLESYL
jgi:hypothetical protein